MKQRMTILFFGFALIGCLQKQVKDTVNQFETKETNSEQNNQSGVVDQLIFDFDINGKQDTFKLTKTFHPDSLEITINEKKYNYEYFSVHFDTIQNSKIQQVNQVESKYFVFFTTANNRQLLYMKDRGDFEGPANIVFGLIDKKFEVLLNEQFAPIEIFSDSTSTYLVVKEIGSEPGYEKGYTYVSYELYRAYNLSNDPINYDELKSREYNFKYNKDFDKYLKMKKPVLGSKEENYRAFVLFDLDTVK